MNDVVAVYEAGGELDRMAVEANRLEWERTCELLLRWLPAAPARVVDAGGGPGRQARWMADRGYAVTLFDLVPLHVQTARERGVTAHVADARQLPQPDASADAVALLSGPLYHLPDALGRAQVLGEAWRVLAPGGVVVAAAMSRWARVLVKAAEDNLADPKWHQHTLAMMRDSQAANGDSWDRCTYRHDPAELHTELEAAGFAHVRVVGVEGPAGAWARRDPALHEHAVELAREAEVAMAACSIHLLAYGVKQ